MPFSTERTTLIMECIKQHLESGQVNEWEMSFLSNMAERFDRYGTKTRLSKAQYVKLHKILKLDQEEPPRQDSVISDREHKPTSQKTTRRSRPHKRPISVIGALAAPRRAVRRAQRQVMLPIVLIFGFFAMVSSLFDSTSPHSAPYSPQSTSTVQTSNATFVYVTGNRVNQRTGPSTADDVMGVLVGGTRVRKVRDQAGWTEIVSSFGTGWMSSSFLSTERPPAVRTSSQGRALRASDVKVIDGDTLKISGQSANVRLVGFNTPETWKPGCNAELALGQKATARLNSLVRGARSIEFKRVACSCKPADRGTDRCNFGRQCGSLYVNGVDVGTTLIAERLAVPYRCGRTSCPAKPKAWCR